MGKAKVDYDELRTQIFRFQHSLKKGSCLKIYLAQSILFSYISENQDLFHHEFEAFLQSMQYFLVVNFILKNLQNLMIGDRILILDKLEQVLINLNSTLIKLFQVVSLT